MADRFVPYLPRDREDELRRIAKVLVAPGKGILAADESNNSMSKRLDMIKLENNEETRRQVSEEFRVLVLLALGLHLCPNNYVLFVISHPRCMSVILAIFNCSICLVSLSNMYAFIVLDFTGICKWLAPFAADV